MVDYSWPVRLDRRGWLSLAGVKAEGNGRPRNGPMQIGELAKRAGITLRAVRYYEELGLINHTVRTRGGFRLYDDGELRKLEMIRDLQELDFPLAKIRSLFARKRAARSGAELAGGVRGTLAGPGPRSPGGPSSRSHSPLPPGGPAGVGRGRDHDLRKRAPGEAAHLH